MRNNNDSEEVVDVLLLEVQHTVQNVKYFCSMHRANIKDIITVHGA